jgi:hypothetical protein
MIMANTVIIAKVSVVMLRLLGGLLIIDPTIPGRTIYR